MLWHLKYHLYLYWGLGLNKELNYTILTIGVKYSQLVFHLPRIRNISGYSNFNCFAIGNLTEIFLPFCASLIDPFKVQLDDKLELTKQKMGKINYVIRLTNSRRFYLVFSVQKLNRNQPTPFRRFLSVSSKDKLISAINMFSLHHFETEKIPLKSSTSFKSVKKN